MKPCLKKKTGVPWDVIGVIHYREALGSLSSYQEARGGLLMVET